MPQIQSDLGNFSVADIQLQDDQLVTQRPPWFEQALQVPMREGWVQVGGAGVHYLEWGDPSQQDLVLLHGNNAHAHWFLPTGALLSDRFHCISMTFSGMGDSEWRPMYDREIMESDVIGVIQQLKLQKPVLMAHSFGGMISVPAAARLGQELGALMIVDFVARPKAKVEEWFQDRPKQIRSTRVYEDKKTCMDRFRLLPDQPCANQWLLEYIAEKSVRPVAGGWTWKFDPRIYAHMRLGNDHEAMIRNMQVPIGFLYGAQTVEFNSGSLQDMCDMMPEHAPICGLQQAQHHLMLDQPLAYAEVVARMADQLMAQN
ncbi:MAG: alpha/beta fold hydrolase [Gammaproteobacteria bacterium]